MLSKFNFFGYIPEIYVNGGLNKTTSTVNSVFSIIFAILCGWIFFYDCQSMINNRDPQTIKSETFQLNPEMIPISPETWNIGFGVQDPRYNLYKDPTIYQLKAFYSIFERKRNNINGGIDLVNTDIPLDMEDCTLDHFGEAGPQFTNINIKGLYCFRRNQTNIDKLEIGGKFVGDLFKIIRVFVQPCDNKTSNGTCATPEKIEKMLGSTKFDIYYTGMGITPEDFEHPYVKYKENKYFTIGQGFGTKVVFNPKPVTIVNNIGWFVRSNEYNTYYQLDFVNSDIMFKNFKYFFQFNIEPSQMKTIYKRTYMGLADVLAIVNGTLTVIFLTFTYLIKPYSKYLYFTRIINDIYDVRDSGLTNKTPAIAALQLGKNYSNLSLSPLATKKDETDPSPSPEIRNTTKTDVINETIAPFNNQEDSSITKKDQDHSVMDESIGNIFPLQDHKEIFEEVKEEISSKNDSQNQNFQAKVPGSEKKKHSILDRLSEQDEKEPKLHKSNTSPVTKSRPLDESSPSNPSQSIPGSEKIPKKKFSIIQEVDEESGLSVLKNFQKSNTGNLEQNEMSKSEKPPLLKTNSMRWSDSSANRSGFGLIGLKKAKIPKVIDLSAGTQKLVADDAISSDMNEIDLEIKNPVLKKEWSVEEALQEDKRLSEKAPDILINNTKELFYNKNPSFESTASPTQLRINDKSANTTGRVEIGAPSETKKIDFTFLDYILSIFCKERIEGNKISLLSQGERKIRQRLDIENIVRKLRDIEKIKILLLDEEQMFLFDHLPKPTLKHKDKSDLTQEEKYYLKLFYPHLKDPMKESNGSVTGDITPDIVTKKTKKKEPDPNLRDKLLSEYYKNLRSRQEKTDIDLKLINAYKQILEQHLNPT